MGLLKRLVSPLLMLFILYGGTAATTGLAVMPDIPEEATRQQILWAWRLFEFRHVLMHAGAFALLGWILHRNAPQGNHVVWVLGGLILLFGIGQEGLQSLLRWQIRPVNSALDVFSDLLGGSFVMVFKAWFDRKSPQFLPHFVKKITRT